ncbi:MAG: hypothetical protein ACLTPN_02530 [Clostridia bacterium]|jgi:hypothetical protein
MMIIIENNKGETKSLMIEDEMTKKISKATKENNMELLREYFHNLKDVDGNVFDFDLDDIQSFTNYNS